MRTTFGLLLVVLALAAAACSVTLEQDATITPPTTVATTVARLEPIVLSADGLGAIGFGASIDAVVADLTSRFGVPDRDTGWQPPEGLYGTCPGVAVRAVGFGSLDVLFTDAGGARLPEFFAWAYGFDPATTTAGVDPRGLDLRTDEGIGLGSSRSELEAAYGSRVVAASDVTDAGWAFRIDPDADAGMRGLLDGGEQGSLVSFVESAPGCQER